MEKGRNLVFSVIIPVYNTEKYIKKCVESLCYYNDYHNFEVILINDGSVDKSLQICKDLANKLDNIIVIDKKNGGASAARKDGISVSRGRYLLFVDSDDWLEHNYLSVLTGIINTYSPDIIYFGMNDERQDMTFRKSIPPYQTGLYNKEEIEKYIFPCLVSQKDGSYFSRSLADKCIKRELCNDFFSNRTVKVGEDGACAIPCIYNANSLFITDACIYNYRYNTSSTTKGKNVFDWDYPEILNKYISSKLLDGAYDFNNQIYRKTIHDLFNVIISRFNQTIPLKEIIKEIDVNLSRPYYTDAIARASFSSKSFSIILFALRHKIYYLFYLYYELK